MADWQGVVIDGRLYSEAGAIALEHVRRGANPDQLADLMVGAWGHHRGWLMMHHHYVRHLAAGPTDSVSTD